LRQADAPCHPLGGAIIGQAQDGYGARLEKAQQKQGDRAVEIIPVAVCCGRGDAVEQLVSHQGSGSLPESLPQNNCFGG
jgi:hypothetical protein